MRQRVKPIIHNVEQKSEEWFSLRLGKVTGSEAKRVHYKISDSDRGAACRVLLGVEKLTQAVKATPEFEKLWEMNPIELIKKAELDLPESEDRKKYRWGKVAERLTGLPADPEPYVSYDMKWGIINEEMARAQYQMQERCIVDDGPFMEHPDLKCGVSPDGISTDTKTGEVGLLEIKCLRTANHLYKIIDTQEVPEEFYDQIQMQMWVGGYDWCDFVGYDSRLKPGLKLFVKRVPYDEEYVSETLEPAIRQFLFECDRDFKRFWAKVKSGEKAK